MNFNIDVSVEHEFSECAPAWGDKCFWCGKVNDIIDPTIRPVCCRVSLKDQAYEDYFTFDLTGLVEMNKRLTSEIEDLKARITKIEGVNNDR